MCGFTCRMFGAPYPDAICIEGALSGGGIPCPSCSTEDFLRSIQESAAEDLPAGQGAPPAHIWERAVLFCHGIKARATFEALPRIGTFTLYDFPGRVSSPEMAPEEADLAPFIQRTWPWPIPEASAHLRTALMVAARGT